MGLGDWMCVYFSKVDHFQISFWPLPDRKRCFYTRYLRAWPFPHWKSTEILYQIRRFTRFCTYQHLQKKTPIFVGPCRGPCKLIHTAVCIPDLKGTRTCNNCMRYNCTIRIFEYRVNTNFQQLDYEWYNALQCTTVSLIVCIVSLLGSVVLLCISKLRSKLILWRVITIWGRRLRKWICCCAYQRCLHVF